MSGRGFVLGGRRWCIAAVVLIAAAAGYAVLLSWSHVAAADDPTSADLPASASPAAVHDVQELPSERTATSRVFERSDGSRRMQISAVPINFRDTQGNFQPIDNTLVDAGNGMLRNKANSMTVAVPRDPTVGAMSVSSADGATVAFTLHSPDTRSAAAQNGATAMPAEPAATDTTAATAPATTTASPAAVASLPAPSTTTEGTTATTTGLLGGVDATYEVEPSGLKETLILENASAPARMVWSLSPSSGLQPSIDRGGEVLFTDSKGQLRFVVPAPTVADKGGEPSSAAVAYSLNNAGTELTLSIDRQWLASKERSFPVAVDPSIYVNTTGQCTLASGPYAANHYCTGALQVGAGNSPGAYVRRGLVRFDLSTIPQDASVYGAELEATFASRTAAIDFNVEAHNVTQGAWNSSATWNTYDGTTAWATAGGDFNATAESTTALTAADIGVQKKWALSKLAAGWVDHSIPNNGVVLKSASEGSLVEATLSGVDLWLMYEPRLGATADQTMISEKLTDTSSASVNVASGNLFVSNQDLAIAGKGLDLNVGRTYNSGDRGGLDEKGLAGLNWVMSPSSDIRLYGSPGGLRILRDEQGVKWRFDRDPATDAGGELAYTTPPGLNAKLVQHSSGADTLTFDQSGTKYEFDNDTWAPVHHIVDKNGNTLTFNFDGSDRTTFIHDTRGRDLNFSYASNGDLHQITDVLGRHWTYTTNSDHTLASYQDPDGRTTSYAYDTNKRLKQITDPRGHLIEITYDSSGRVATFRRVVNGTATTVGTNDAQWTYTYNASGTASKCTAAGVFGHADVTDPEGHVSTYCFNKQDQVVQAFDPLNHKRDKTYTPNNDVATVTSPGQGAGGLNTTYSFNSDNSPTSIVQQTGANSSLTTTVSYDTSAGNTNPLKKYTPSLINTPKSNGSQGSTDHQLAFGYDSAGNLSSVTSSLSVQNQLTQAHGGPGGQISSSTDARGNTTTYGYNANGEMNSITPPSPLGGSTITYDAPSRVKTFTDGKSQTSTYTYDGEDRVTRVDYSDGSWVKFTYDANGNETQRQDSSTMGGLAGITNYTYDNLNRATGEDRPTSFDTTYAYDRAGNLKTLQDSGGAVTYAYNAANLLTSLVAPDTSTPFTFAYDNDNNRIQTTRPNGLTTCTPYDLAGRLQSLKTFAVGTGLSCSNLPATLVQNYSLTYTLASGSDSSLIQSITDAKGGDTTNYDYDVLDRLTRAQTTGANPSDFQYAMDGVGNRTRILKIIGSTTTDSYRAFNNANELCEYQATAGPTCPSSPGAGAPGFDANGNMTTDGNGRTIAYNIRDQMTSITPAGGSAQAIVHRGANQQDLAGVNGNEVALDGLGVAGLRQSGTLNAITRDPTGTLLARRNATNSLAATRYYLTDPLGSISALTNSAGAQTAPASGFYRYDPDGASIGAAPADFGYRGGQTLPGGLIHDGMRYYDPQLGVWTQQDPVSQALDPNQVNAYSYASCDPINSADPSGLETERQRAGRICQEAWHIEFVPMPSQILSISSEPARGRDFRGGTSYEVYMQSTVTGQYMECHAIIRRGKILHLHLRETNGIEA
jgi:RHS repeat-associated protein